jgi:hypothetical protein
MPCAKRGSVRTRGAAKMPLRLFYFLHATPRFRRHAFAFFAIIFAYYMRTRDGAIIFATIFFI